MTSFMKTYFGTFILMTLRKYGVMFEAEVIG